MPDGRLRRAAPRLWRVATRRPLEIAVIRDLAGLEATRGDWDALVRGAARPSPFLLHAWMTTWWRHFGAGAALTVVTARREGRLVGALPSFVRRRRGLRVCRLLGAHESALGDLLLAPGEDDAVGRELLDHLTRQRFDYVDAFGMPAGSALVRCAPARSLTTLERVEAPVLLMPDGWDAAYAARTSAKKRNLHRRRLRQLSELGAVTWTVARTPTEVATELEYAFHLHARRWEGRPDGSTFGTPAGRAFHREAAAAAARDDVVRIVTLRIDGRPVAFHYYFALDGTMYVHRLAFEPDVARLSPGQVTLLHTLDVASQEGITRVEFLGGDERYKLELADTVEPLHQAIGLARNVPARAAVHTTLAVIEARKRLKRNPTLKRAYDHGLAPVRRLRGRLSGGAAG